MLELFTLAANRIAEESATYLSSTRRTLAKQAAGRLSENAKRMLAEIFSAEYVNLSMTR